MLIASFVPFYFLQMIVNKVGTLKFAIKGQFMVILQKNNLRPLLYFDSKQCRIIKIMRVKSSAPNMTKR